jgi:two-component sensor histidine kinase
MIQLKNAISTKQISVSLSKTIDYRIKNEVQILLSSLKLSLVETNDEFSKTLIIINNISNQIDEENCELLKII